MPEGSDAWVSACVAPAGGKAGVYLSLRRGPITDRLFAALSADQAAINNAIGESASWSTSEKWHGVQVWHPYGDQMLGERRSEVMEWLGGLVNRFVNAFRPRISSLLREQKEAEQE